MAVVHSFIQSFCPALQRCLIIADIWLCLLTFEEAVNNRIKVDVGSYVGHRAGVFGGFATSNKVRAVRTGVWMAAVVRSRRAGENWGVSRHATWAGRDGGGQGSI